MEQELLIHLKNEKNPAVPGLRESPYVFGTQNLLRFLYPVSCHGQKYPLQSALLIDICHSGCYGEVWSPGTMSLASL